MKCSTRPAGSHGAGRWQCTRTAWPYVTSKAGASLRDQFKFKGFYKHEGYDAVRAVVKVDVDKSRAEAGKEDWK